MLDRGFAFYERQASRATSSPGAVLRRDGRAAEHRQRAARARRAWRATPRARSPPGSAAHARASRRRCTPSTLTPAAWRSPRRPTTRRSCRSARARSRTAASSWRGCTTAARRSPPGSAGGRPPPSGCVVRDRSGRAGPAPRSSPRPLRLGGAPLGAGAPRRPARFAGAAACERHGALGRRARAHAAIASRADFIQTRWTRARGRGLRPTCCSRAGVATRRRPRGAPRRLAGGDRPSPGAARRRRVPAHRAARDRATWSCRAAAARASTRPCAASAAPVIRAAAGTDARDPARARRTSRCASLPPRGAAQAGRGGRAAALRDEFVRLPTLTRRARSAPYRPARRCISAEAAPREPASPGSASERSRRPSRSASTCTEPGCAESRYGRLGSACM